MSCKQFYPKITFARKRQSTSFCWALYNLTHPPRNKRHRLQPRSWESIIYNKQHRVWKGPTTFCDFESVSYWAEGERFIVYYTYLREILLYYVHYVTHAYAPISNIMYRHKRKNESSIACKVSANAIQNTTDATCVAPERFPDESPLLYCFTSMREGFFNADCVSSF